MATKNVGGLCVSFTKLYRGNASTISVLAQRMYATVDEGDQVIHTGQVRGDLLYKKEIFLTYMLISYFE